MAKKDCKPKAKPSGEKWIVYIVRCADGSLYSGITKDLKRRCQQHNAGTASRYTRSRRPVKLIYQEVHPDQSSALRREAAIKAMTRKEKLAMTRLRKKPANGVREIAHLEDIPNIGPAIAADLLQLGITTPADLPGRDPYAMYDDLCRITRQHHDPCLLELLSPQFGTWKVRRKNRGGSTRRNGSGRWQVGLEKADLGYTAKSRSLPRTA